MRRESAIRASFAEQLPRVQDGAINIGAYENKRVNPSCANDRCAPNLTRLSG